MNKKNDDTDWSESSWFFVALGVLSMVFYGKKETGSSAVRVVKWRPFYYFMTTFHCLDLPRSASICGAMTLASENMTRYDITVEPYKTLLFVAGRSFLYHQISFAEYIKCL